MKNILIIDAQGGGIGRQLVKAIKEEVQEAHVIAVGTNIAATQAMLKAGADEAATGENSVVVASRKADIIVGPIGILITDSMMGEITERMASAVSRSDALRILIPFNNCYNIVAGVGDKTTAELISLAVEEVKKNL